MIKQNHDQISIEENHSCCLFPFVWSFSLYYLYFSEYFWFVSYYPQWHFHHWYLLELFKFYFGSTCLFEYPSLRSDPHLMRPDLIFLHLLWFFSWYPLNSSPLDYFGWLSCFDFEYLMYSLMIFIVFPSVLTKVCLFTTPILYLRKIFLHQIFVLSDYSNPLTVRDQIDLLLNYFQVWLWYSELQIRLLNLYC